MNTIQAEVIQWGDSTQISTSKNTIDNLIKTYVNKKYPNKVKTYHNELSQTKSTKISKYEDVTFIKDNLMWQDNEEVQSLKFNTLESSIYCRKLRLASRKDWRVPTFSELLSLVDYDTFDPAYVENIEFVTANRYWSVTKNATNKQKFWYVDFRYGTTGTELKSNKYNLRCVRKISKKQGDY